MESPIHSSYTLTFYFLPVDGYLINGHPQLLGYVQDLNVKCPTHRHTHTQWNCNTIQTSIYSRHYTTCIHATDSSYTLINGNSRIKAKLDTSGWCAWTWRVWQLPIWWRAWSHTECPPLLLHTGHTPAGGTHTLECSGRKTSANGEEWEGVMKT